MSFNLSSSNHVSGFETNRFIASKRNLGDEKSWRLEVVKVQKEEQSKTLKHSHSDPFRHNLQTMHLRARSISFSLFCPQITGGLSSFTTLHFCSGLSGCDRWHQKDNAWFNHVAHIMICIAPEVSWANLLLNHLHFSYNASDVSQHQENGTRIWLWPSNSRRDILLWTFRGTPENTDLIPRRYAVSVQIPDAGQILAKGSSRWNFLLSDLISYEALKSRSMVKPWSSHPRTAKPEAKVKFMIPSARKNSSF